MSLTYFTMMAKLNFFAVLVSCGLWTAVIAHPPGTISPLAETCGPVQSIVCINKYAAVMPYHFFREPSYDGSYEDTYSSTSVQSDSSWDLVGEADFLVFDENRGLELLGPSPSYKFMFELSDGKTYVDSSASKWCL